MWCIDEYIMANIQNNLDFITAIEQEIHIWASSLFLCGLKREYQKQKKRTHRCICTYKNCTQESKIVAFVVFLSLLFSFYIPFTWFESFYGTCVACLLLPLLIFSLAMQRILPSEFSYSDVPYNILWIVWGHVRCMRACVCVCLCLCVDCMRRSLTSYNCHNFTLTVLLAASQFILHVFSDCDFPCAIFRHLLAIPFSLFVLLLANYLNAAA